MLVYQYTEQTNTVRLAWEQQMVYHHACMPARGSNRAPGRGDERRDAPVLEVEGLSVSFGGVQALDLVSFGVDDGELVGLIGPNGAGKTTLLDAVTGFVPSTGRTRLDGSDISGLPAHEVARLGVARTWQAGELFDDLTVRENLAVAHHRPSIMQTIKEMVSKPRELDPEIEDALSLLGISEIGDAPASDVSQAQRKLVGVARALVADPRIVCLDEPAAGLDVMESKSLGQHLREIVNRGLPLLLIDHDMSLVLSICDRVVVLEFGEVIASGPPDVVSKDPKVVEAYLGSAASSLETTPQ